MIRSTSRLSAVVILACCSPLLAQTNEPGTVSSASQVTIHAKATAIQFRLFLQEQGDTMEAA